MLLLFSGGIDSYVAYHYLHKPHTLYFNLHTPYSEKEMKVVQELIPGTIIDDCLDLNSRQEGDKAYIPFRNLYLALLANKYDDTVCIAGLKDDCIDDKNEKVFDEWSSMMSSMMEKSIMVFSPFWHMTKEQIVRWYLQVYTGKTYDDKLTDLLKTISCYSEQDTNYCGACPSCFRKWCAFVNNRIEMPFRNTGLMLKYYEAAMRDEYIPERNLSIIHACERSDFIKTEWKKMT